MDIIEALTTLAVKKKKVSKKDVTNILKIAALDFAIDIVYSKSKEYVKRRTMDMISISVSYNSEVSGYTTLGRVQKILYDLDKEKFDNHRIYSTDETEYELKDGAKYIISCGSNTYIKVRKEISDKIINGEYVEFVYLNFFGKNKFDVYKKFIHDLQYKRTDKIFVTMLDGRYDSSEIASEKVTFDNIIMEEESKNIIINGLKSWKESTDWYTEMRLVHKVGILLYGEPGTGKSSTVKAISSFLDNAPIYSINSISKDIINNFLSETSCIKDPVILLIEDMDLIIQDRKKENSSGNKAQNLLFQILDGLYSMDNIIVIATSNYKNNLDPALIRPGRFDIQVELKNFNKEMATKFVNKFGYTSDILDKFDIKYPIQSALLQSKIMELRSKELYGN